MIGEKDGEPEYQRANLPESATPDEITLEMAEKLFATPQSGRELGVNPDNGRTIVAKEGRFGPYVTELVRDDEPAGARRDLELDAGPDEARPLEDEPRGRELGADHPQVAEDVVVGPGPVGDDPPGPVPPREVRGGHQRVPVTAAAWSR